MVGGRQVSTLGVRMKLRRFLSVGVALVAVAFDAQVNAATVTFAFFDGASSPFTATLVDDPKIDRTATNGRWTFTDTSADIVGITGSNGAAISKTSSEIAQIKASVPELPIWAMVGLNLVVLALVGYRSRRSPISIV
jgi:hypothetical protein